MAFNFSILLVDGTTATLEGMPSIDIDVRGTDKKIVYDKNLTRLDRLAGDIYEDETLWKIILWANPDFDYEYDIPDGTVIRIPWPKQEVLDEVTKKIITKKNLG
jgi:hypothetical protein